MIVTVPCCFSDDDSELSDNEEEPLPKGEEGLLNGGSNGMIINGSLSRDGEFHLSSIFLYKLYSASVSMYACLICKYSWFNFVTNTELRIDKTRLYNFSKIKKDRRWLKVMLNCKVCISFVDKWYLEVEKINLLDSLFFKKNLTHMHLSIEQKC